MDQDSGGRRRDGKPYKPGNMRDDGSYGVGKNRPPAQHRFAKGDGRPRGRRGKGTKNLQTDWSEELAQHIVIKEGEKQRRVTKQRAVVKQTIARALKGSDRASEHVFRHAGIERAVESGLSRSAREILDEWLEQQGRRPSGDPEPDTSDDQ